MKKRLWIFITSSMEEMESGRANERDAFCGYFVERLVEGQGRILRRSCGLIEKQSKIALLIYNNCFCYLQR